MRRLLIALVLMTPTSAFAERFLPAEEETRLREIVPPLADTVLTERINDESQTYFYTSKRFWQREYGYSYNYTYINRGRIFGRRSRRTIRVGGTAFQQLTPEITDVQWRNAGDLAAEPDIEEVKFISLPKRDDGTLIPMIANGTEITYPNGTIFGGLLCRGDAMEPVEFRIREKIDGDWKSTVCLEDGEKFAVSTKSTKHCAACHKDAGTFVASQSHGWSGVIGSDRNYSFGEWAANVLAPGNLSEGLLSASMLDDGLLERYDADKHTEAVYGIASDY